MKNPLFLFSENRMDLCYILALAAGKKILNLRGLSPVLGEKDHLDLVSQADKEAEKVIISGIEREFPEDGILSEESPEKKCGTNYRWIIDPLDGTHNFLFGFKEFGTLIAIEKGNEIIFGICYFPLISEIFVAIKGQGAFLNGKRISVSETEDLKGEIFCSDGTVRHRTYEILRDIEMFCVSGCRLRVYGSSPFGFSRVALGQAVVATNRVVKPWDVAAPSLLVEEAGGRVTDQKGNKWSIYSESLIATNKKVHQKALSLFNFL